MSNVRKSAYLTIRLPERVAATIRAMADAEKRSYANQVWHLIEVGLKAEQEKALKTEQEKTNGNRT